MASIQQIVAIIVVCAVLVAGLTWWFEGRYNAPSELLLDAEESAFGGPLSPEERDVTNEATSNTMNPIAVLNTNQGVIEIELYADQMPITAGNFATLVESGYYDGIKFHRVIDGFMIQGGDPNSKGDDTSLYGTGGPGYAIEDEHVAGELLSNVRGTISMANSGPNSGGSQFFINTADNLALDFDKQPLSSKHPVFGRVVSGMEIVDTISKVATGARDIPIEPVVIESAALKSQEG